MDCLAFAPHFEPGFKAGGALRSVAGILDSSPDGVRVELVTGDRDLGDSVPYAGLAGRRVARGQHHVTYINPRRLRHLVTVGALCRRQHELLYLNTLWNPIFGLLPLLLWRVGLVRADLAVLAPRGQLMPGAMRLGSPRKRFLLPLLRIMTRRERLLWHASTTEEAEGCRELFGDARIVTSLDPVPLSTSAAHAHASGSNQLHVVFVGRVAPKKNLWGALVALLDVTESVRFTIVGPYEDQAYWQKCQALIGRLPANVVVDVVGPVSPQKIVSVFASNDVFACPTLGENFGHVIAESLAAACPVICGPDTPWGSVLADGGGTVIDPLDSGALAKELSRRARMSYDERLRESEHAKTAYERWRRGRDQSNVLGIMRQLHHEAFGSKSRSL